MTESQAAGRLSRLGYIASGVIAVAAVLLTGCGGGGDGGASPKKPNILLIVADDLGYSDIGAFGGEIRTPNLDALATEGRILTDYHVAPTCSPTRSMLFSGTDHHLAGLGSMAEGLASNQVGQPGYEGYLNDKSLSIAQLLRDGGYHTYLSGKWHLGLNVSNSPKARGFESSFALLQGGGSHFSPVPGKPTVADLAATYREDGEIVKLPANFFSSDTYTDKLIGYIDRNKADGKPFFAYAAYTAPHWPLHAPDDYIDRYRGRYDAGYDAIRTQRIARQKALGIVPADFQPSANLPGTPDNPTWEQLTPAQKQDQSRRMEVYAAMVDNLDHNIGRLIRHLKDIGEYENTLVFFQSDNGAEGGPSLFPNNENVDNSLANLGRRQSNIGYGPRWAEVSATPFRLWKASSTEGGVVAPAIVRLPGQAGAKPAVTQLTHVTDLAPTFLQLAGLADPGSQSNGKAVNPLTGFSLLPALQGDALARPQGSMLAEELFGNRSVRRDNWKLLSLQPPYGDGKWELYDLSVDRAEANNLIAARPDIVASLKQGWREYVKQMGVIWSNQLAAPAD